MAAFTVIGHTELGAAAAAITFASISSSYDHLYLKASLRCDSTTDDYSPADIELNNDSSTSNYSETYLKAESGTPQSGRYSTGTGYFKTLMIANANTDADYFSTLDLWIPNYSNTANFKQVMWRAAVENASASNYEWILWMTAGLYHSTSAIDQVELSALRYPSTEFVQYSSVTLYGVTGA